MVQLPEVYPRTVQLIVRSPRAQNTDVQNRGPRDNAVRLDHVEPARVPLRHAAPSPPQLPDSLHRLAKERSRRPPDFISVTRLSRREVRASTRLYAGGGSCLRGLRRAWRHETAEVRDVRRIGGGRGLCGGVVKRVDGVFPGRPQSLRLQRLSVDDCSPGRGGMAQDSGTRGGTFRGEMDRCRESQAWTTACSSMPECDGKNQGEDSPKQAGSCWFARHSSLATSGANLYPPGECRVVFFWRFVCFVLFCFFTTVCVFFRFCFLIFLFLWRCRFFRVFLYHYRFLFVWRLRRTFFPSGLCFSTL